MLRTIYIKINADKTISLSNPFTVYQGEANKYRLEIDTSSISNYINSQDLSCTIGFKRETIKTDFIPTTRIRDYVYEYILKSDWLFDKVGKLWVTVKLTNNPLVGSPTEEYAGNTFIFINALANYLEGSSLPPSAEALLQEQIDELNDKKLDKDFTEYTTYNWEDLDDDEYVAINKNVDGVMTVGKAKLQDLYNRVNDIAPVDGNIELDAEDIPYEDTDVKSALDNCVYHDDIEDVEQAAYLYEVLSLTMQPSNIIYSQLAGWICNYNVSPIFKLARIVTISFNYDWLPSGNTDKPVIFRITYGEDDFNDLTVAYNSRDRVINTGDTYYDYVFVRTSYVSDFVCANRPKMRKVIQVRTSDWSQYSQGIYTCNFAVPNGTTIFPYTVTVTKTNPNTSETQVLPDYIISGNRIYLYFSSTFDGKIKIFE